jgi:P2 family phage contractile tail tube protein
MATAINRLTNANVYVDGVNFLGRAEEVNLPDMKFKMSEHKALGMFGTFELPSGVEKLEAKIKWNSAYPDALRKSSDPFTAVQLQIRGSLETYVGGARTSQVPYVVYLTGTFKNAPTGNFKQHDNVELESMFNVTYMKQEIDGADIVEFDVMANIYKVDGVDKLNTYKANIGG